MRGRLVAKSTRSEVHTLDDSSDFGELVSYYFAVTYTEGEGFEPSLQVLARIRFGNSLSRIDATQSQFRVVLDNGISTNVTSFGSFVTPSRTVPSWVFWSLEFACSPRLLRRVLSPDAEDESSTFVPAG